MAVAVVGIPQSELRPGPEQRGVGEAKTLVAAVGIVGVLDLELASRAQKVRILETDLEGIRAARAFETGADREGPDVPGHHQHVDAVVAVADRPHRRVVEVLLGAQVAGGFVQQPGIVAVAGREQQLALDHPGARGPVQPVGDIEQQLVLLFPGGIEDVPGLDIDLADHGAVGDQHVVGRNRRGGLGEGRLLPVGGGFGGRRRGAEQQRGEEQQDEQPRALQVVVSPESSAERALSVAADRVYRIARISHIRAPAAAGAPDTYAMTAYRGEQVMPRGGAFKRYRRRAASSPRRKGKGPPTGWCGDPGSLSVSSGAVRLVRCPDRHVARRVPGAQVEGGARDAKRPRRPAGRRRSRRATAGGCRAAGSACASPGTATPGSRCSGWWWC